MTSDNKIKIQTTEGEPTVTFVRQLTKPELISLGTQVFFYGLTCGIFLSLFVVITAPWVLIAPFVLYFIWFALPVLLIVALLSRNHFLTSHFNEKRHGSYLEFGYRWRILVPVLTFLLVFYYSVFGFAFHDPKYFALSITVLLFMIPLFLIYDKPLTEEGEITILFEMLSSSISNFHEAQQYWKRLAKKIEKLFKAGNVQVLRKDLIYNFSMTLLEGNEDISDDLTGIREWMLGRARTCLKELSYVCPKTNLRPCEENIFIDWFLKNPEVTLNYIFKGVIITVVIVLTILSLNPNLIGEILKYLHL